MKHKKVFYALTVSLYVIVLLLCLSFLFSVQEVKCNYSMVTISERYQAVNEKLEKYENKNLLFVNTSKIKKELQKDPYIKVISIKKDFPNKILVNIEERREMFSLETETQKFILDENYFVLKSVDKSAETEVISLKLNYANFSTQELKVGKEINAIQDDIIVCVNQMLSIFSDWKNILKGIEVEQVFGENNNYRVYFYTNQGVVIEIRKALEDGTTKAQNAYDRYSTLTDYEKTKGKILSYKKADGTFAVDYTLTVLSKGDENA